MLALAMGIRAYNLGMGATVPLMFFPFFAVLIGVVLAGGAETAVAQQPASGADAPRSGLLISTSQSRSGRRCRTTSSTC